MLELLTGPALVTRCAPGTLGCLRWQRAAVSTERSPEAWQRRCGRPSSRSLWQATWRHALFGAALGILEQRLNARREAEPPFVPASSNGHGNIEQAATAVA